MTTIEIPQARDLSRDGALASARRVPLLLYFSQDHCSFCHRMEEEILIPMLISGQYEQRMLLREVLIDEGETLIGFDGKTLTGRTLFYLYDGIVTPTLVLTDGSGLLLTKPLVGINTVELFGWYLDNAIDAALHKMRTLEP